MNIRVLVFAALAVLFGFAAQAEDYSLAAGESATLTEGSVTYGKMTIAGDLTVPNLSTAICNNVTISGTMTVDGAGSYIGAANFDASSSSNSKFTFAPGATESDPHGRLVVTNRGMIGLGAITINAGNNQDAEVLDFLELTDGGRMHIRSLTTSSKLPARINVSGTGGSFLASTSYIGAKFFGKVSEGRNKFIINMNNAPFNYYSGASSWNDEGIEVDVVGTGDFSIYDNSNTEAKEADPEKNTEIRFRTGARFRHTGAINVLRPAKGANFCSIRFMVDDVVGENVTGMFVREGGGVDAYVKLSIDEGVTVDLKTLECDTGGSTLVLRDAGTLRLGAAEGASKLGATSFDAESTMTIEKVGVNELTVTRDLMIPTLNVMAGSVRFAAANACRTLLGSGKVIVNSGKTLCVEDLSAFAGVFAPATGDVWARGEYELCYFKGDLPTAATAAISADDQFAFSSEEVAEGDFAGYKVLKLAVTKNVISLHFTESGEVDLAAAAGGTFYKTCEVEIDPDVTVTNTTALVGPGKLTVLGGGTLVLSVASPDHAAGVYIGNATVAVTTGTALGTGDVTVEGCGANGQISRLWFDVQDADATIPNDITFETEAATKAGFVFVFKTAKNIHFTGDIVAKAALSMTYSRVDTKSNSSSTTKRFFFEGAVDVGGALTITGQYGYVFSGSLKATYVYINGDAASPNNVPYAYLDTTDVDVGYFMTRKTGRIVAEVANCFGNAGFRNNDSAASGGLDISTYDQKLAYLDGSGNTTKACGIFASADGTTLTLTGGGSDSDVTKKASTRLALSGKLNLVVDQTGTGDYTQTIYGTNTTSGTITVKKGTLNLSGSALFRNVPAITVSGGALNLDSKEPNAFAGLAKLTVSGGAFTISDTTVDALPNDGSLVLSLTSGATLSLPSGTALHIAKLFIDGALRARSTPFTHDDFAVIPEGVSILADGPIEYVCTESGDLDIAAIMGGADVGCNLTIPAGITVTNTTAIPSTCKQVKVAGGGELVLTEASAAFAGGFYVDDAVLRVTAADVLGSGDITVVGYKNAGGVSAILFDTGSAEVEFGNDIHVLSNNDAEPAFQFGWLTGLLTLSGEIVSDGNLYLDTVVHNATQSGERLRLTGSLTTAGEIRFTTRWMVTFHGKVTAPRVFAYGSSGSTDSTCTPFLHFFHEANEIGYLNVRKAAEIHCQVENAFAGTYFSFGDVSNSGGFELRSFDQTLEYISNDYTVATKRGYFSASAAYGATLTLTGDGTERTVSANNTLLSGGLSLVVDQQGDNAFVQSFTDTVGGTAHSMTGSIGVRKGTLNFTGAVTLANVPAINVEGGALNLTTTADGAFAGVKNLAISGGTFTIDGTGADPFGAAASTQTEAAFSGEGRLSLGDGVTATVYRACTNGVYLEAGEYTGADSTANALQLPQLSGNGVLKVLRSGVRGMILFVQ